MQLQNKKLIIGVVVFFAVGLIISLVLLFTSKDDSEFVDDPSGETVSIPKNRQSEKFGAEIPSATFYGIAHLTSAGLSNYSISLFRDKINDYSSQNNDSITRVSVYQDSIVRKQTATHDITTFKIRLNDQEDANVEFKSEGVLDVAITVTKQDGTKIVDTGVYRNDPSGHSDHSHDEFTGDGVPPEQLGL